MARKADVTDPTAEADRKKPRRHTPIERELYSARIQMTLAKTYEAGALKAIDAAVALGWKPEHGYPWDDGWPERGR